MEAQDWLAVYAAVVASSSLGWQIYTWWKSRQPAVRVKVTNAIGPPGEHWILLEVVNNGEHPVTVTSLGLNLQDGTNRTLVLVHCPPGSNLPGLIDGKNRGFTYIAESNDSYRLFDLHKPLSGFAHLATGEKICSKPSRLFAKK